MEEIFGQEVKLTPCSYFEGSCGHQWQATFAVVKCPGCQSLTLMSRQENCPFCNEPISKISIRNDHIPRGAGVAKRCLGEKVYGDSQNIELTKEILGGEPDGKKENSEGS